MNPNWCGCDGHGNATDAPPLAPLHVTRRQALLGGALAAVAWVARGATALADVAVAPGGRASDRDVLVTIFLRGGADGLNLIVPHGDDGYYRNRPTIGVPAPTDKTQGAASRAIDLDGFFGLHPALLPLRPFYDKAQLAAVHACGSFDHSRSHFEAMAAIERGLPDNRAGAASGWLARHLASSLGDNASPLRAVALASTMPDALRGATTATAVSSLADFRFYLPGSAKEGDQETRRALAEFYAGGDDAVARAGRETLAVLDTLNRLDPAHYRPAHGVVYPNSELGNGLKQVACLIRGKVGLEVACLDHRGPYLWDTHVAQNNLFTGQVADLGQCLAAFARDMGPETSRITTLVMTEFGRRLHENSGLGTDHGRAGVMLLLGGGIRGGKVYARWPGLGDENLEPPGDLQVTTDYRDVLAEIVARRLGNGRLDAVFPDYAPQFVGVVK